MIHPGYSKQKRRRYLVVCYDVTALKRYSMRAALGPKT